MPLLFSYGTLQQEDVQLSTFGRLLQGQRDELLGFETGNGVPPGGPSQNTGTSVARVVHIDW